MSKDHNKEKEVEDLRERIMKLAASEDLTEQEKMEFVRRALGIINGEDEVEVRK